MQAVGQFSHSIFYGGSEVIYRTSLFAGGGVHGLLGGIPERAGGDRGRGSAFEGHHLKKDICHHHSVIIFHSTFFGYV